MFFGIVDILLGLFLAWLITLVSSINFLWAMMIVLFADYFYKKGKDFWDEINK